MYFDYRCLVAIDFDMDGRGCQGPNSHYWDHWPWLYVIKKNENAPCSHRSGYSYSEENVRVREN